jgi:hypothetical protein
LPALDPSDDDVDDDDVDESRFEPLSLEPRSFEPESPDAVLLAPSDPPEPEPPDPGPLVEEPLDPDPPVPSELSPEDVPLAALARVRVALERSFFAQPVPLKWMLGATKAFRSVPSAPQAGQNRGPGASIPWMTSVVVRQLLQM